MDVVFVLRVSRCVNVDAMFVICKWSKNAVLETSKQKDALDPLDEP